MASPAFERFRFSFFEDPYSARNGLDTLALAQLEGDERDRAEQMLLQYLPGARGAIGLGVLRSRRAEAALVPLFEAARASGFDNRRIYLAKSLWRISARSTLARSHDRDAGFSQGMDKPDGGRHRAP